jgi:hypothetical protein
MIRTFVATLSLALASSLSGQQTAMTRDSSAKGEVEQVMGPLIEAASSLLEKHGEFYPIAGYLDAHGLFHLTATHDGNERPTTTQVISDLRRTLKATASPNGYRAVGLAYDVRVTPPGQSAKTDAILVELEHKTGYRVNVYWPYTPASGRPPIFGKAFAEAGSLDAYVSSTPPTR